GLKEGAGSVQASVSSASGNAASAARAYSVDSVAPSVTIDTLAGNDVLNAAEAQAPLTVSGSSTAQAGQTVTVSLDGQTWSAEVGADGRWSLTVPVETLATLSDGVVTLTAAVSDRAGNPASVSHALTVDKTVPTVTILAIAGDDVINLAEHGQSQIISGAVEGAAVGDRVTVTLNGQRYAGVVDAGGMWSVGIPASAVKALADGTLTVTVSVTDAAGNTGSGSREVVVDTGLPSLSIDALAQDNILNAQEKGEDLTIAGGSANLANGATVTVTLNGREYQATAGSDGRWSVTVPAADLAGLGEATYTVTASGSSASGNAASGTATLRVDTALPGVFISPVAGDDVINAAEVAAGQTLSGRVTGAEAGSTVTVTLGGNRYAAEVQPDLSWSVTVPEAALTALGNGALTVTATVTNAAGNTGSGSREVAIDAGLPGVRINPVAGDDVVNVLEHQQALVVSGSSSGLPAGGTLTVTVNGKTYPASVAA
ncbi:Ig-like domain-containing protein, partial [Pantoea sp. 1.19]|uniref:Ig-like domain-containing protein n=1 Tax=Pantoea sp. 1.19 TaxID=1925589 RepID=UPI00111535AE